MPSPQIPGAKNVTGAQLADNDVVFIGIPAPQSAITTLLALKTYLGASNGTFTVTGATQLDVADVRVTANSQLIITLKTAAGTIAGDPYPVLLTPGVGFSVKAGASDTSVYNYVILG